MASISPSTHSGLTLSLPNGLEAPRSSRTVAHPRAMTIAAVKRRGRHSFLIRARIERKLGDFGIAFRTRPHHAVFRLEHGAGTCAKILSVVSLKHYYEKLRIHTIFRKNTEYQVFAAIPRKIDTSSTAYLLINDLLRRKIGAKRSIA